MSNPDAKINEVFTDGAEVVVELQEEVRSRKGEARSERSGAPTL